MRRRCTAGWPRGRRTCPFGASQTPHIRGLRQPEKTTSEPGMSMKTKDTVKMSSAGADVAFERLRSAEGAQRMGREEAERAPSGHRRPHTSGVCASPAAGTPNVPLRGIADPTRRGSAPARRNDERTGNGTSPHVRGLRQPERYDNRRNKARMSMKTKDRLFRREHFQNGGER